MQFQHCFFELVAKKRRVISCSQLQDPEKRSREDTDAIVLKLPRIASTPVPDCAIRYSGYLALHVPRLPNIVCPDPETQKIALVPSSCCKTCNKSCLNSFVCRLPVITFNVLSHHQLLINIIWRYLGKEIQTCAVSLALQILLSVLSTSE